MTIKERIENTQKHLEAAQAKIKDAAETAQIAAMLKKDELDDRIAAARGDVEAAKENVRRDIETGKGKLNSDLLKMQMSIDAAKEKLAQAKKEVNASIDADRIADLLDYAEKCQELAVRLAAESELALLEAAAAAVDYVEKYGEDA